MILPLLQILAFAAVAIYFGKRRAGLRRRNHQSWDSLLARLRVDWSARELSDHFLWKEGLDATPDDAWQRMEGPNGPCAIYQNSRVPLQMPDFAAPNNPDAPNPTLPTPRSDAMQIRVCVLMCLAQYGFSQASEGVRINAFRAASMYTGMAARMTELLQNYEAGILPDFVAAM